MGDQKSEIDRDEVRKILKKLKDNLAEFESGKGTRNDISVHGNITNADLGQYPAVQGLVASTTTAYTQIKTQYDSFLQSYDGIIQALERIVGNHDEKEQQNAAAANRTLANGSGATPTTSNTSAY
ncbi:hypothetical protein E1200_16525 [Actinomadura sp. GC306]|uniref:hypothetical protein n=1 Tax=Actinomadura sp. GC306 TaxID=2530367 RepID=UPI00104DCA75|nr:hypothetical protein [Actinomadura sp. GC306]TDC66581.1 hypothetical protein E1200_16525 [Actinomadura sp. GC306]